MGTPRNAFKAPNHEFLQCVLGLWLLEEILGGGAVPKQGQAGFSVKLLCFIFLKISLSFFVILLMGKLRHREIISVIHFHAILSFSS